MTNKDPMTWLSGKPQRKRTVKRKMWELTRADFDRMSGVDQGVIRQFASGELADLRAAYEKTRNGAHAWRAWRLVRATRQEPPGWIMDYLDRCAEGLAEAKGATAAAEVIGFVDPGGGHSKGNAAADEQFMKRESLLRAYAFEVERMARGFETACKSKREIFAKLAEQHGISTGAMEGRIRRLMK